MLARLTVHLGAVLLVLGLGGLPATSHAQPRPDDPAPAPKASPTEPPAPAEPTALENRRRPEVRGKTRWPGKVRAFPGRWDGGTREHTRFRWFRDGERIRAARGRTYRLRPEDVDARLSVAVRVRAPGLRWASATSRPRRVRHSVPVRRVVTYRLETRGRLHADVGRFARLAQQTYDDPRGWRRAGIEFRRVRRGGQFSLVLSEASWLTRFSSGCSATWSCRVGRYVVINQTRWRHASPAWNRARRGLRDYRHMVVNHETGHWLGRGHRSCPGRGRAAPVMMQQSKGTGGCRFNPWPTRAELR